MIILYILIMKKKSNCINMEIDIKNSNTECIHEGYLSLNIKYNYTFIINIYKFDMETQTFIKIKTIENTFEENNNINYTNMLKTL